VAEKDFKSCFSKKVLPLAERLRTIVRSKFPKAEEGYYGGAKVKLVLYSQGGSNNVLCGIQEGKESSCILYVHHVKDIDHKRLKFTGKGKHAKQVRFNSVEDVNEEDIRWLLDRVEKRAPFFEL